MPWKQKCQDLWWNQTKPSKSGWYYSWTGKPEYFHVREPKEQRRALRLARRVQGRWQQALEWVVQDKSDGNWFEWWWTPEEMSSIDAWRERDEALQNHVCVSCFRSLLSL